MKLFFSATVCLCLSFSLIAQTKKQSSVNRSISPTLVAEQKEASYQLRTLNFPPDLKFTALNVSATPAGAPNTYHLNVSFTISNVGKGPILAANATYQCFISNEDWLTRGMKDLSFTGYLSPAGGAVLGGTVQQNETLAPGSTRQFSFTINNQQLSNQPRPIFIVNISTINGAAESDQSNNLAYVNIIL